MPPPRCSPRRRSGSRRPSAPVSASVGPRRSRPRGVRAGAGRHAEGRALPGCAAGGADPGGRPSAGRDPRCASRRERVPGPPHAQRHRRGQRRPRRGERRLRVHGRRPAAARLDDRRRALDQRPADRGGLRLVAGRVTGLRGRCAVHDQRRHRRGRVHGGRLERRRARRRGDRRLHVARREAREPAGDRHARRFVTLVLRGAPRAHRADRLVGPRPARLARSYTVERAARTLPQTPLAVGSTAGAVVLAANAGTAGAATLRGPRPGRPGSPDMGCRDDARHHGPHGRSPRARRRRRQRRAAVRSRLRPAVRAEPSDGGRRHAGVHRRRREDPLPGDRRHGRRPSGRHDVVGGAGDSRSWRTSCCARARGTRSRSTEAAGR